MQNEENTNQVGGPQGVSMHGSVTRGLNPFDSAKTTTEALYAINDIRTQFKKLAFFLDSIVIPKGGREMALAKTHLEESAMWAIKSISHYNIDTTDQAITETLDERLTDDELIAQN